MKPRSFTTHTSAMALNQTDRGLTLILFTITLIWPMLYNGFPLVFADTDQYIRAATERFIPVERPAYYSFFLVYISDLLGIYAVPIVQALCISYVILVFIDSLAPCASTAW